jgi:hypothetical protein
MTKLITLTTLTLCLAAAARAQSGEYPSAFSVSGSNATSKVYKDARIDLLVQKQIYLNTLALRNMPGFRVQVISTMNRSEAIEAKARLMKLFPQYTTYLSYQSPYFRVRIGDFRDRAGAEQLQQQLNDYFPNGVFTVADMVRITPKQLLQNQNDVPND